MIQNSRKIHLIYVVEIIIAGLLMAGIVFQWKHPVVMNNLPDDLPAGSYSLTVHYTADSAQKLLMCADNSDLHFNTVYLSRNKEVLQYDFYTVRTAENIRFEMPDYTGGQFVLTGIEIRSNTHNLRILLFLWIILSVLLDIYIGSAAIRNHRALILSLIGIAFLPSMALLIPGISYGHDLAFHLARIESIAEGLKTGQFPVRMYSAFNDGYGYPVGIFYGDLLLYLPAVLRLIGFTVTSSYKIYIAMINLAATVLSYCCFRKMMKQRSALMAAMAFAAADYRLTDLYVRSAVGEYSAILFFPVIFLAVFKIYSEDTESESYRKNWLLLAIGMTGLFYTHVLSTEMMAVALFITAIVFFKKTFRLRTLSVYVKAVLATGLMSMGFLIPFLDYYLRSDIRVKIENVENTKFIQQQGAGIGDYFGFFSDYFDTAVSRMRLTPGFVLMAALAAGIVLILMKKAGRMIKVLVIAALVLLAAASDLFPWNALASGSGIGNLLAQIQFPWRYLGFVILVLAVLLGFILDQTQEKKSLNRILICGISAVIAIESCLFVNNYKNSSYAYKQIDTAELSQYTCDGIPYALGAAEYVLKDTDILNLDYDVKCTNAEAVIESEQGIDMTLKVDAGEDASVEVPRFHYRHYVTSDENGRQYDVVSGENQKIKILIPESYSGELYLRFEEPWYWRGSELISLICAGMVFMKLSEAVTGIKRGVVRPWS